MKKLLLILGVLLTVLPAYGQFNRWDWFVATTNVPSPTPGNLYPLFALPGSTIAVCNYPSNAGTNLPCTNYATTYNNISGSACPTNAQLTAPNSTTCTSTADSQGNFGAWLPAGNYVYTVTVSYGSFGPYPFNVNAGANYCPLSGCTFIGNINTPSINNIPTLQYNNTPRPFQAGWLFSSFESFLQPINIIIIGDSQTICYNALTSCLTGPTVDINRWSEQLRILLQTTYGSHGTGMVPVMAGVTNNVVNNQYWAISGSVNKSTILGPSQSAACCTGSSLVQLSNGEVLTFTPTQEFVAPIPYDHLNVYCATTSSSGSLAVAIDGVGVGSACGSTTGTPTAHVVTFAAGSGLGTHTATLTCTGACFVYAAEGTAGTAGISVSNLATASAASAYFGSAPSTQLAFSDLIPNGQQLLLIDLGTNDSNPVFGYSSTTYATNIQNILTHEAGLAGAPSVLIIQPPVSNNGASTGVWATYTAALFGVVTANPVDYVNIQNRWGTSFVSAYFCADGIHPCDAGSTDEGSQILNKVLPQPLAIPIAITAENFIAQNGGGNSNPFFQADCNNLPCDAGMLSMVPNGRVYSQALWSSGTGGGLPGVYGVIDQGTVAAPCTTGCIFPWNTNASDDMCFDTPISGGNVAACVGALLKLKQSTGALSTPHAILDDGAGDSTYNQITGSQAVTIGACTGTNGSGTFNCPGSNNAGSGATASCFIAGGNQCTLISGLVSITTGSGAGAGDLFEVKTTGSATAKALNCTFAGGGTGGLSPALLGMGVDLTGTSNGQFQFTVVSSPSSSHQYLVFYNCTQ